MDENNSPRKKKRRLSLSLSKYRERFSVCTAEDIEADSKKNLPRNTLTAVNWAFQVFDVTKLKISGHIKIQRSCVKC